jgi:hypothetical protein
MGGTPYWSTLHAFSMAPMYGFPVQQVGPSFTLPPPQQSPPSTPWFREWYPQSLAGCLSSTTPAPPTPVIDWVADSDATNRTRPHLGHIFSHRPPSLAHPSSIVVGNGPVLPVTSVGDSVLPGPFYLNDVLLAPVLVQSLFSVRRFTTDNSCSMEFDPIGLSVKDVATRRVLARYDSTGPLYTLPLPTSTTPTPRVVLYALTTATSSATWHRRSTITCHRGRDDSLCHAC